MGFIASSTTLSATAYLTELGRQYLFDSVQNPRRVTLPNGQTIDRFKITRFSLGDPDINYDIPIIPVSGQIVDISGENETSVKGTKGRMLTDLISPSESDLPKDELELVEYKSTQSTIRFDIIQSSPNARVSNLKTVVNQQLMTYVDGELVSDGVYIVTPTNYGKNVLNNNELVIVLREPTLTQDGYRLRIIYPTTGDNYNKMTFQFEKASAQKAVITTSVATNISTAPVNVASVASVTNATIATQGRG